MSEPFIEACKSGNIDAVISMIESNPDSLYTLDTHGRNCLGVAVNEGN